MGKDASRAFSVFLVAIAALAPTPALAVTLDEGGEEMELAQRIEAFSDDLQFTSAGGNVECEHSWLEGEVVANGGETAAVKVSKATVEGTEAQVECDTTIKGGLVKMFVTALNLPWPLEFEPLGASILSEASFKLTAKFLGADIATCVYDAPPLEAMYVFKKSPLLDQFPFQALKLDAGASKGECPEVKIDGAFVFTSFGNAVEATE